MCVYHISGCFNYTLRIEFKGQKYDFFNSLIRVVPNFIVFLSAAYY